MKTTCIRTRDLALGRVDAVVLDEVLAERGVRAQRGARQSDDRLGVGHYVGVTGARERGAARSDRRDAASRRCATAGSRRSSANGACGTTTSRVCSARCSRASRIQPVATPTATGARPGAWEAARALSSGAAARRRSSRSCCRVLSMALAVAIGILIATGRVYGGRTVRSALTGVGRGRCAARRCCCSSSSSTSASRRSCSCRRSLAALHRPGPELRAPTKARSIAARSKPCRRASSRRRARWA